MRRDMDSEKARANEVIQSLHHRVRQLEQELAARRDSEAKLLGEKAQLV
jgi:hypothetical protein